MLKFFRKIRFKLLEEGFFKKYLFYAFGEILLVVIGILIAMQINNWNEARKRKMQEIKTLKELRSDLFQNLTDIKSNIIRYEKSKSSSKIILYHIENHLPYSDSLDKHFFNLIPYVQFTINQTTYENLKSIGFDLISNDSLRASISNLYAHRFSFYQKLEDRYLSEHYYNYLKPMVISQFSSYSFNTMKPRNYEQFITDPTIRQTINFSIVKMEDMQGWQFRLQKEVEKLIDQVELEVER